MSDLRGVVNSSTGIIVHRFKRNEVDNALFGSGLRQLAKKLEDFKCDRNHVFKFIQELGKRNPKELREHERIVADQKLWDAHAAFTGSDHDSLGEVWELEMGAAEKSPKGLVSRLSSGLKDKVKDLTIAGLRARVKQAEKKLDTKEVFYEVTIRDKCISVFVRTESKGTELISVVEPRQREQVLDGLVQEFDKARNAWNSLEKNAFRKEADVRSFYWDVASLKASVHDLHEQRLVDTVQKLQRLKDALNKDEQNPKTLTAAPLVKPAFDDLAKFLRKSAPATPKSSSTEPKAEAEAEATFSMDNA